MQESHPRGRVPFEKTGDEREGARHYIPASEEDLEGMLRALGLERLEDLYREVPEAVRFAEAPQLPEELDAETAKRRLAQLAGRNRVRLSFLGDGLPVASVHPVTEAIAQVRGLTTAYTPYQPERSQGTLLAHWIYQCQMAQLTGFEAINSSLYDRASALFEAMMTSLRLRKRGDVVVVPAALYPGDLDVVTTLAAGTPLKLVFTPLDAESGRIDAEKFERALHDAGEDLAAAVVPQVGTFGVLEDVHGLTRAVHTAGGQVIAVVNPLHLAPGGLVPPSQWGETGADLLVGEAQHLAIGPNFGGPGLGLFGVRHNAETNKAIRHTPGRYVGKGVDSDGRDCRVMVLSTREQHIRKERATSNICSNQAFLATLAGAALLVRGDEGLGAMLGRARAMAREAAERLTALPGVELAFRGAFLDEFTLEVPRAPIGLLEQARREANLHLGVDVSKRIAGSRRLLKVSFNDQHDDEAVARLVSFFEKTFGRGTQPAAAAEIPVALQRVESPGLRRFAEAEVVAYYQKLGELNFSPDEAIYPLGSCTMKYNPKLNDWAAGLPEFMEVHPQAPLEDCQGALEVLYQIQEWFRAITGLPAVTTQPVAGAQGELVGIKLFQAYHAANGEAHRDVILIPKTAHGTNFATAIMAGYTGDKAVDGKRGGIVLLNGREDGRIDLDELDARLAEYAGRLAGIMITNPNTSGLFETDFREIAERVHASGGLVYMDGANMNAIAGWCDLGALGVDAVHNNLHKTWSIPHGGGGPGDAIVAVSERLAAYLPGHQIVRHRDGTLGVTRPTHSIGSFHRHWGNFAHKVRALAYLLRLGRQGVPRMSAVSVLAARYLAKQLAPATPLLPRAAASLPRMHEFILTLQPETFAALERVGISKAQAMTALGKAFLDFGYHAPTVAWPEPQGIMIEPTESFTKAELDAFADTVLAILELAKEGPELIAGAPRLTPTGRIDEVAANRQPVLSEPLVELPPIHAAELTPGQLRAKFNAEGVAFLRGEVANSQG